LLNKAKESTKRIIDNRIEKRSGLGGHCPRYGRGKTRANSLNIAKQKKPHRLKITAAIRRQLEYLQRNLGDIDTLIASGVRLSDFKAHWWQKLLVISELYRQQSILLYSNTRRIPDRIVNLVQRQVRPIARGKARAAFEFGDLARRASACGRPVFLYGMVLPSCTELAGILTMSLRI
jgi:hypothetical protein